MIAILKQNISFQVKINNMSFKLKVLTVAYFGVLTYLVGYLVKLKHDKKMEKLEK